MRFIEPSAKMEEKKKETRNLDQIFERISRTESVRCGADRIGSDRIGLDRNVRTVLEFFEVHTKA